MIPLKKILLFSHMILPIPAIGGGAVESLITGLIEQNELHKKVNFIVIAKYDPLIRLTKYEYTKIYYFDEISKKNYYIHENKDYYSREYKKYRKKYKLKRRLLKNRIIRKFYKKPIKPISEFLFQCYLIAKRERVDFIVNEGNWDSKTCALFYRLVRKENVYYHLHYHRDEIIQFRKELPNSIAISQFVSDSWVKDKTIPGKNYVLYNGVDLSRFKKNISQKEKESLRQKLGFSKDDFVVIFCGRIIPEKGVEQLLDAFDKLNEKNIKLLLIGSVGFSSEIQTDFSRRMIKKASKMDNVLYLGYIPNENMPLYYQISQLQVIPSVWQEGAGLVCIEGMASGLPLIITKSGGMIEYTDQFCSIQIPIDSMLSDNLAKEIRTLYRDKEKRKAMAEAGKKRAELFSIENYYRNFIDLFD